MNKVPSVATFVGSWVARARRASETNHIDVQRTHSVLALALRVFDSTQDRPPHSFVARAPRLRRRTRWSRAAPSRAVGPVQSSRRVVDPTQPRVTSERSVLAAGLDRGENPTERIAARRRGPRLRGLRRQWPAQRLLAAGRTMKVARAVRCASERCGGGAARHEGTFGGGGAAFTVPQPPLHRGTKTNAN